MECERDLFPFPFPPRVIGFNHEKASFMAVTEKGRKEQRRKKTEEDQIKLLRRLFFKRRLLKSKIRPG